MTCSAFFLPGERDRPVTHSLFVDSIIPYDPDAVACRCSSADSLGDDGCQTKIKTAKQKTLQPKS